MSKTQYEKQIGKILTPEVIEGINAAEEKRFEQITEQIKDESEPFLERLQEWIDDYLVECYSRGD